ncbi:acetyl-CoA carboxylase carboxyl transferase subunit alpha [Lactobacillus salivarius]|nr:acetyl-CoA carboxylase carboxyl transferase subunit alpha [Ligilactobacillus salivarius]
MPKILKKKKTASEIVAAARGLKKVTANELIDGIFDDFFELHGDRKYSDDEAIIGGIALFNGIPITVIATDKGGTPEERIAKHFGCPEPSGYRKSLRLMKQAEKFNRPIVTFVNTSGAYPGRSAEENGQGEAIARNLLEMSDLKVPIISFIYGEGGSGGALALACGDQVWMLEDSMYSILSPEGFASILWKDSKRADEAAEVMQLTPEALLKQEIIEGIILESNSHRKVCKEIKKILAQELKNLTSLTKFELVKRRKERYRKF